jgi:tripartite-type tricarboxylate transporter receptor subunit TctC
MNGRMLLVSALAKITPLVLLSAMAVAAPAWSDVSYEGKRVTLIISAAPGGGSDGTARMVGRYISRHLPGNPNIIFQNVPGAGGISALNSFVTRTEPDGLTFYIGAGNQVNPVTLRRTDVVKYDPSKLKLIGAFANDSSYLIVRKDALQQLTGKGGQPVMVGELDGTRSSAQMAVWGAEALKWNVKWVLGYTGTPAMIQAVDRGEVDMIANNSRVDSLIDGGKVELLAQTGMLVEGKVIRSSSFADVPIFAEQVEGHLDGLALRAFQSWQRQAQIGKWFALPPATPEPHVSTYRKAFDAMLKDQEFQTVFAKTESADYKAMSVADIEALMAEMVNTPDDTLEYLQSLRKKYGM